MWWVYLVYMLFCLFCLFGLVVVYGAVVLVSLTRCGGVSLVVVFGALWLLVSVFAVVCFLARCVCC